MSASADEGDVVVESTCGWKAVVLDGQCAVEPRSCGECLNETPTSGEECELLPLSGLCRRASSPLAKSDPTFTGLATAVNPLLTNTSQYCSANDRKCSACLAQSKSTGAVCRGDADCVCVGMCESKAWGETTRLLLGRVFAQGGADVEKLEKLTNCSSEWKAVPARPLPTPTTPAKSTVSADDECMWSSDRYFCTKPRSCYDCLNTPLASGTQCTITPQGYCTTIDAYEGDRDYRLNGSASASHFFPSSNTTYCESTDATCAACKAGVFAVSDSGRVHASQFCVGEGGCVCVGFCASPNYADLVASRMCDITGTSSRGTTSALSLSVQFITVMLLLAAVVAIALGFWLHRRARDLTRARGTDTPRPRPPKMGPPLELQAWKAYCSELVSQEQRELADSSKEAYEVPYYYLTPPSIDVDVEVSEYRSDATRESCLATPSACNNCDRWR